jgi:hypothetical protein
MGSKMYERKEAVLGTAREGEAQIAWRGKSVARKSVKGAGDTAENVAQVGADLGRL